MKGFNTSIIKPKKYFEGAKKVPMGKMNTIKTMAEMEAEHGTEEMEPKEKYEISEKEEKYGVPSADVPSQFKSKVPSAELPSKFKSKLPSGEVSIDLMLGSAKKKSPIKKGKIQYMKEGEPSSEKEMGGGRKKYLDAIIKKAASKKV
jgi:hypothetical protein